MSVAVALLLALLLAACGGDDDSGTADSTTVPSQGAEEASGDSRREDSARQDGGSSDSQGGSGSGRAAPEHDDSGGGSEQFKTKGADNSLQEFGKEGSGAEFDQAAAAVHGFFDARVRGDWKAACSYLAADVTRSLKQLTGNSKKLAGADCAKTLETISEGAPQEAFIVAAEADVGSLRVEGGKAFVLYRGAQSTALAMPMVNEGGVWKVASLAGTPVN